MFISWMILLFRLDFCTFPSSKWGVILWGFLISFFITFYGIPIIVKGAKYNKLYANPNGRTSHFKPTPALGGIAIFAGFILSVNTIACKYFSFELSYLITSLIVIFIVGLKDDLMGGKPWKKLIGQIISVTFICVLADIRIMDLRGFLNIGEIPYFLSISGTLLILLAIINGINLIDGIDGLAAGIGIINSIILGSWFFLTENIACAIMSASLCGSLVAFFYFNVFSGKNKIFLGDTGSQTVGLILGVLAIRFLQLEPLEEGITEIHTAPAFVFSLFIIPLFDTFRVFSLRLLQGKSPFKADRQHTHHKLLEMGYSHLKSTFILLAINILFILICYSFQFPGNILLIVFQIFVAIILSYYLSMRVRKTIYTEKPNIENPNRSVSN